MKLYIEVRDTTDEDVALPTRCILEEAKICVTHRKGAQMAKKINLLTFGIGRGKESVKQRELHK
jgi:hypothetical protein